MAAKMTWHRITAGIYEAQHQGHTYRVESIRNWAYPSTAWMLRVDGAMPDDAYRTKAEAQEAALELT